MEMCSFGDARHLEQSSPHSMLGHDGPRCRPDLDPSNERFFRSYLHCGGGASAHESLPLLLQQCDIQRTRSIVPIGVSSIESRILCGDGQHFLASLPKPWNHRFKEMGGLIFIRLYTVCEYYGFVWLT